MKEPHSEGLASHTGPESCGCDRKGASEALTGGSAGRVLSLENAYMGAPTQWTDRKARSWCAPGRVHHGLPVVGDLEHA